MLVIGGNGVRGMGRVDVSTFAESPGKPKAGDAHGKLLFGVGGTMRGSRLSDTGEREEGAGTLCRNV